MVGIFEERTSNAAVWCQRIAVFLVPFFALVILLYRFSAISTIQMFVLIGIGLMLAFLALVLALRALSELWSKGYRGGTRVVQGMIITLLILLPFGYSAFLAIQFPLANDISTDTFNPPEFVNVIALREKFSSEGMNPIIEYTDEYSDLIVEAYPKVRPHRYPAGPDRVLEAVLTIVRDNEWPIIGRTGVPEAKVEDDTELEDNSESDDKAEEEDILAEDILIEVLERTPVFSFENDVVIRIISEDQNTLVDVRSASRWGKHDFGYNAKLIESFLLQLDAALLGIAGEG